MSNLLGMSEGLVISIVGLFGSLILALVAVLNLMTSRQLLIRVNRQLEIAESQSEMNLIRNAFVEMSEFLQIFVEKPHLRPYFYDDEVVPDGDEILRAEVSALAEWILTNFATAISLSIMLPNYPIGALKETIKFHLRHSKSMRMHLEERFSSFPVTGLTLLRFTYETKAETLGALNSLQQQAISQGESVEVERLNQLQVVLAKAEEFHDLQFTAQGLAGSRAGTLLSP